jgi:hypothetical protein
MHISGDRSWQWLSLSFLGILREERIILNHTTTNNDHRPLYSVCSYNCSYILIVIVIVLYMRDT